MDGRMERELKALVEDFRQLLEGEIHRGVTVVPVPSPETTVTEPAMNAAKTAARDSWYSEARTARTGRTSLSEVRESLGDCRRCGLCKNRKTIVFGVGDERADLMIIGEAPGYHEDQQGEPFVGAAGQMLDKMLENVIGLRREQVYIANVVKCRPPKNRNPLPDEVEACRPFLEAQIRAIQPKIILILGTVALKAIFGADTGIMRARGIWKEWAGTPVLPTFHPAYLLRNPSDKRKTFEDLKALTARYDAEGGRR